MAIETSNPGSKHSQGGLLWLHMVIKQPVVIQALPVIESKDNKDFKVECANHI